MIKREHREEEARRAARNAPGPDDAAAGKEG